MGICHDAFIRPDRLEYPQSIFPNEDTSAKGAKFLGSFVYPNRPPTLAYRNCCYQAGESATGDFGMTTDSHWRSFNAHNLVAFSALRL
jgi:hypothetical protein